MLRATFDMLVMTVLAVASVGLWTVRVALTARARVLAACAVAAVEAVAFACAFAQVLSGLTSPLRVVPYALGVALGTGIGLWSDRRLFSGTCEIHVFVGGDRRGLAEQLCARGFPATAQAAWGPKGPATLLVLPVAQARVDVALDEIERLAPGAFSTVQRSHAVVATGPSRPRPVQIPSPCEVPV